MTSTKDAMGSRKGTQSAKINAVLLRAKAPLTVAETAKRARVSDKRVRNHFDWLAQRGLISY